MKPTLPSLQSQEFSPDQKHYLEGFFAGIKARGMAFADLAPATITETQDADLTREERIKRELHPFDAYSQLVEDATFNKAPDAESVFRYKWNGLFWLNPVKDGYMCRLRIPGGQLKAHQLREVADIADDLTTGYIQITTRSNFQIRMIEPKNCPEVLRRIQSCGLHTRGAGADNIRNITATPTAGLDPYELIDVSPHVHDLAQTIISTREFYDLPRKFNVAIDGGGLISSVEDTNDIGATAVRIGANDLGLKPGVWFRIALGGVTGHQTFARDWGVVVEPRQLLKVMLALMRVFIRDGDRTNRKKARLKYLVEKRGLNGLLDDCEQLLGSKLSRLPVDAACQTKADRPPHPHPHVGVYPQKQEGLYYIGASVPVGQLTSKQVRQIAEIAESYGSGDVRLTVWQNFLLPNIPQAYVDTVCKRLRKLGFDTVQSHLRSGFVACTGNRFCKYSATDTKAHAIELMDYLDKKIKLDQPVNIHFTGCPHSCAQHYMGDIGLLGAKVKNRSGETVEGYHVCLGGGFGANQKIGRQIFTGIPFDELKDLIEKILRVWLSQRLEAESFQAFCNRHDIGKLQELFTNT
ncbi:MAG: NirA family protein [Methylacidiphilales bacterium]|nr:NirA family protein [Candidatus Methylacidiphilales bacterium]